MKAVVDIGSAGTNDSRVSVVVPSFNHARYVEECLRSIFKQTTAPVELIVVDDGSKDGSPQIIEDVLKECSFRCELLVRSNRGLSATLNEGFEHCRGKYFAYLGSDDVWFPEFLDARVRLLETRPKAVLAYGNAFSIDESSRIVDCSTDWADYVDGDARRMLMSTLAPLSPTVVYRRSAIEGRRWNENARLEDYELYLRLSIEGEFAFDPRVLSAWRVHGQNSSLNLAMMMREKVGAQARVGAKLGFTPKELIQFQSIAMFRTAQEYMRRNEKSTALRLMLRNLRGVQSPTELVRMLGGLLAPPRLLAWRKSRREQQAGRRYGSVNI